MAKFRIDVLDRKTNKWNKRTIVTHTRKGRALTSANDALRYGYGIGGTRPRMGEAMSKSGKRFRAVAL